MKLPHIEPAGEIVIDVDVHPEFRSNPDDVLDFNLRDYLFNVNPKVWIIDGCGTFVRSRVAIGGACFGRWSPSVTRVPTSAGLDFFNGRGRRFTIHLKHKILLNNSH